MRISEKCCTFAAENETLTMKNDLHICFVIIGLFVLCFHSTASAQSSDRVYSPYGQCDFNTFLNTYFDVYETSDTLTELELYGKGLHKWHLKHTDECYDYALRFFPTEDWCSACAYAINNRYLLEFSEEVYTDTALVVNSILILCDNGGVILDKYTIQTSRIEYADVSKNGIWSQDYTIRDTLIWRMFQGSNDVYTEKQFRIDPNRIVPLEPPY